MRITDIINEDMNRRGFLRGLGGAALAGAGIAATKDAEANSLDPEVFQPMLSWNLGMVVGAYERGVISQEDAQQLIGRMKRLLASRKVRMLDHEAERGLSEASRGNNRFFLTHLDILRQTLNTLEKRR